MSRSPQPDDEPPNHERSDFKKTEAVMWAVFLGVVAIGLLALIFSNSAIEWSWEYWGEIKNDGTVSFNRSAIMRNFGLFALGVVGLALATWRGVQNHQANKLTEKGLVIDRYQKGASMLESGELSVRLAGIYALKELVKSDPDETYILVQTLFCDFVRERSKERRPDLSKITSKNKTPGYGPFPPDLQKAMETISWLRERTPNAHQLEEADHWQFDLIQANLANARLNGAWLNGAELNGAMLNGAELNFAVLNRAKLNRAWLNDAVLNGAELSGAELNRAELNGAELNRAELNGAELNGAVLNDAGLIGAELSGAELNGAKLNRAKLNRAKLNFAVLNEAELIGAKLNDAELNRAELNGAWLNGAELNGAVLNGAVMNAAELIGAKLNGAELNDAVLNSAKLNFAELNRAWLNGAELNRAWLNSTELSDAVLNSAKLNRADFANALIYFAFAKSVDLSKTRNLTQVQINSIFAVGDVKLPNKMNRPNHWINEELSFEDAYERWIQWTKAQMNI